MKTMGRLLEADGGQLQQPNRLQPLEKVNKKFFVLAFMIFLPSQVLIIGKSCNQEMAI